MADTTSPYTSTLTYDAASELTRFRTMAGTTLKHDLTLGYNANGDRTGQTDSVSGATTSYGYDQADRLITATNGMTASSYVYNGDGLRMSKTVSGTAEAYTWDVVEGLPLVMQDGTTRYVTGPGGLPIEQVASDGTALYYVQDQLGSTRGLLNGAGQVVASYTYGPYGARTAVTGTVTTPFGYAGQYTDAETGFVYLRARYYDPSTEQFLSRDPLLGLTGEPYTYAGDNPLNELDPLGLTTGQFCVGFQAGFGLGGFIQVCPLAASIDTTGAHPDQFADQFGFTISVGGGKYTPSAVVQGGFTGTNADTLDQLRGGAVYAGGSAGEGPGVGIDVSAAVGPCHPIIGVSVSGSVGVRALVPPVPIPFELHSGVSQTWVVQYSDIPKFLWSKAVDWLRD